MKVKKKLLYYLLGIAAIVFLALEGPMRMLDNGGSISPLDAILHLSENARQQISVTDAFESGLSMWQYTIMPVAASLASSSFIYEEIKSKMYMGTEFRKGKYGFVYSRFLYSAVSGGVTVALGMLLFVCIIAGFFPLFSVDEEVLGTGEVIQGILGSISYVSLYGMAMSAAASFLVYLYSELYVNLSILFILGYLFRGIAMEGKFWFPLVLLGALGAGYGVMWKVRSERL